MISAIGLGIIFATMLFGKLYPKETMIVWTLIILVIVLYPIITNVQVTSAALCSCSP